MTNCFNAIAAHYSSLVDYMMLKVCLLLQYSTIITPKNWICALVGLVVV
jgi:hypothetical protein